MMQVEAWAPRQRTAVLNVGKRRNKKNIPGYGLANLGDSDEHTVRVSAFV
jgi:hypothetical protein